MLRTDTQILRDVRDTLAWDVRIDDCNLDVDVTDGIVTLSGTVRTYSEKTVAADDAWKIKGVKSVVDRIVVSPENLRLDADIAADVENALTGDNRLDAKGIAIKVANGIVELSGSVSSLAEKEAAEEDAWFADGVTDVANYIEVTPTRVRSDGEIEDDIRTAIGRDARIGAPTRIGAEIRAGRVVLRGQVQTTGERQAAEEDARFTAGVVSVRNEIEIVAGSTRISGIR
ncbi:MAG: BON domain-containing protein [Chloroflexi bacterium]|nr:BON domain-containing protein [Chloroflexota bacterium]